MKIKLKQFIPKECCLKCDGCCRFIDKKSQWVPRIAKSEILKILKSGFPQHLFSKLNKNDNQLNLVNYKGINICAFLFPQTNRCKIYNNRPFDCQLYPFILMRNREKIFLSVHLACPFVKENLEKREFKNYLTYLKEFLNKKGISSFIRKNIFLAQDYDNFQDEIKLLFCLDNKKLSLHENKASCVQR
ncbi:MAG: YkgJ family cysteine cluster protein [Candidatus Omnitrophota bacterium]|nr:YkgJ family cysteine cluster protein [Candidatus Omnitrophota bacterium]